MSPRLPASSRASRLAVALLAPLAVASGARVEDAPAVLHPAAGGQVAGVLKDSDVPGRITWQGAAFASPFDFAVDAVNAVHWPVDPRAARAEGASGIELVGGDLLLGDLISLDETVAVIDAPRIGRLTIPRSRLRRIDRRGEGSGLVYLGPNGMTEWRMVNEAAGWREEAGQLVADKELAAIQGDFGLPARAVVEFVLSWKAKADFVLALGIDGANKAVKQPLRHAFRFEIWENELVAQRETESAADVASLGPIAVGPGRVHLIAYLDQEKGRLLVTAADGRTLADLKVAGNDPEARPGIHLGNLRGDLRLEQLRISRWHGEAATDDADARPRLLKADGTVIAGPVVRSDGAKAYRVRADDGDVTVPEDQVSAVLLAPAKEAKAPSTRVVYQDGNRLSGELTRVADGKLRLKLPGVDEPVSLTTAGLRSIVVLHAEGQAQGLGGGVGRLETDGASLPGRLADGREAPGATCLAWQPTGSDKAAALRTGRSGRLVYKETPKAEPAPPQNRAQVIAIQRAVNRLESVKKVQPVAMPSAPLSLYLRSGDVIPSTITRIGEEGVWFQTPLSDSTFVAHDRIKAVELAPEEDVTVKLSKPKFDRLTTLPRMQRDSPPTHLIRSRNGDFLRGRLIAMDDKTLKVEIRLEPKDLPRDRVAKILWLHEDEIDPSKTKPAEVPEGATRVQAVRSDGTRLTFFADRVESSVILGRSDVLGPCKVKVDEVDQILIGGEIEKVATQLAYQQWKLHNAEDPKIPEPNDDGTGGENGTQSPLVGKPAPDFKLNLLDGRPYRLDEQKGHVVVLDFWATWCGPCLQAMPQVEKVAGEFHDKGVELIAVNLEETPEQIKAMLSRHKLNPTVALDRDGVVARRYQANAIPQTVIIDREGKVARLFVGGGPRLGDQLREALKAVLGEGNGPASQ